MCDLWSDTTAFCILWTPRQTKWHNKFNTFVIQNIFSNSQILSPAWQTYRVVFCVPVSFAHLNFGSFIYANAFKLHQISWMDSADCNFQLILQWDSRTLLGHSRIPTFFCSSYVFIVLCSHIYLADWTEFSWRICQYLALFLLQTMASILYLGVVRSMYKSFQQKNVEFKKASFSN